MGDMALEFLGLGPAMTLLVIIISIWCVFWKILGLWFSARKGDRGWFAAFIFVNLLGILEIYYLHHEGDWPFG